MPPPPVGAGRGGVSLFTANNRYNSADKPLSLWERGWGEGENDTFLQLGILKSYKKTA